MTPNCFGIQWLSSGRLSSKERVVMANHITDVHIHKRKIHVFCQLHGKMFVTWNRLCVCIRILILLVVQMQTNIYVIVFILLFRVSPCADMTVYIAMDNWVLQYSTITTMNNRTDISDISVCLHLNTKEHQDTQMYSVLSYKNFTT
jgi:hypothetical protein